MKKLLFPIIIATVVVLLSGCAAARKVPYFKNIDSINLAASRGLYDARIMPKDLLSIAVVTSDQETSRRSTSSPICLPAAVVTRVL